MTGPYDPRAPRKNPEIRDILRAMRRCWADLKAAGGHSEMRGHAMVLQAHIEQLLDEPEFVYDLASGAVSGVRAMYQRQNRDGEPGFLDEGPFDRPGRDQGRFFYYTYSGVVTPLFVEAGDPYFPFQLSVYWVYMFEQCYAGEPETSMHVTSEEAMNRIFRRPKRPGNADKGKYGILMDPGGFYSGNSVRMAGMTKTLGQAIKKVDRLTKWLQIRFVAARLAAVIHTH